MTETQARAAGLTEEQIAAMTLDKGGHSKPAEGHCLLEVVSMMAGEKFGDSPECVDPVLAAFGRSWNDRLPDDERQGLKKYIPLLVGTYKGQNLQIARAFIALDWMTRTHLPMWLDKVPELAEHAATLRALAPITAELGEAERTDAIDKSNAAARAARAAWDAWAARAARAARAAWDAWAAWDARAAWDAWAARDARAARAARDAWDARAAWDAWAAAAAAAQTAAFESAKGCATYEEARAKADAVFMAHRDEVQAQLHDLYTRMINAELQDAAEPEQLWRTPAIEQLDLPMNKRRQLDAGVAQQVRLTAGLGW